MDFYLQQQRGDSLTELQGQSESGPRMQSQRQQEQTSHDGQIRLKEQREQERREAEEVQEQEQEREDQRRQNGHKGSKAATKEQNSREIKSFRIFVLQTSGGAQFPSKDAHPELALNSFLAFTLPLLGLDGVNGETVGKVILVLGRRLVRKR